jgi:hypothetical protein
LNPAESACEFNDISIVSCLTGWLPEPIPLRFGHGKEVWKFLRDTITKYQWPEEKPVSTSSTSMPNKNSHDDDPIHHIADNIDIKEDVNAAETATNKEMKSDLKTNKKTAGGKETAKLTSGKDTKMEKHKKDTKDKKGKSMIGGVDESQQEENFSPDFPEMVVFASFTDLPVNKISASSEVVR